MADVQAVQKALQDVVRQLLASPSASIEEQIVPAVSAVVCPQGLEHLTRAQASAVYPCLRSVCLDIARDAAAQQASPMQFTLRGAAGPALPRLMQVAIECHNSKMLDQSQVLQLLDELQDVTVVEHCLDIITWLEQHRGMLAAPAFKSGHQQLIRLCNAIHRRLGKHDVIHRARLLMLIASCTPLFDRSGVNVQATFAPADPPPVEVVPDDAVDSAGKPVDTTLYTAFWKLQPMIQDALKVLRSAGEWDTLHSSLNTVLEGLSKSPATVAAVHSTAAAGNNGSNGSSADVAMTEAAAAGGGGGGSGSECYLSSYKLFGLQLADSAFRRGFLVQVLILLRTLLLPGKQPTDTLKDKARMQAVAIEKRVYQLLEATPKDGPAFAAAVRELLQRETSWVEWKKGGKPVKGAPAAAAGKAGTAAAQQQQQGCNSWEVPPLTPPLAAAVAAEAETRAAAKRKREGQEQFALMTKSEADNRSKVWDWKGEPFMDTGKDRATVTRLLGRGASTITFWSQQQMAAETSGANPPPLMAGLKVSEQQQYPLPERVCAQLIREMSPNVCDTDCKRVVTDAVYRWRISRAVAQEAPQYEGSLITADGLEEGMMHELMPPQVRSLVSPEYAAQYQAKVDEKKRKEEEERRARQQAAGGGAAGAGGQKAAAGAGGAGAGGATKQQAAGGGSSNQAAAAAAGPEGGGGSAAVKAEPAAEAGGDAGAAAGGDAPPVAAGSEADAGAADAAAVKQEGSADGLEALREEVGAGAGAAAAGGDAAGMDVDAPAA